MELSELFWNASLEALKKGYKETGDTFTCLLCGKETEKGIIYPENGAFYEAERYMRIHIEREHLSIFEHLINLDKKLTGLSDHQNSLLRLFYEGKSDAEVQKAMGIGSSSTIRNHRFVLKEKERQARVFIVLMELLREKDKRGSELLPPHRNAKMVDDRYHVTMDERHKILKKYFPDGVEGPLKTFDMREKSKLVVLREIAARFEHGVVYTEREVNEVLKTAYEDFSTLRRYLIEYGFMEREPDGSQYWVKEGMETLEPKALDKKKTLKHQFKEAQSEAGVYQIRNMKNQKVLLVATSNIKTMNGRKMELQNGAHRNKELQTEWNQYGEQAFNFEVLEILEDGGNLRELERKWIDKLQPYGDRGYHKEK